MTQKSCLIQWDRRAIAAWESLYGRVRRASLLQSPAYALAVCPLYGQKARLGCIDINGEQAGIVMIREAGLGGQILHGVMMDGGPLWLDGYGSEEDQCAFFNRFAALFPRRPGRMRRIIPAMSPDQQTSRMMAQAGYRAKNRPPYETIWIDLEKDEAHLKRDMSKKWCYALSQGERRGFALEWDETGESLPFLMDCYRADKARRRYKSAAPAIMQALAEGFSKQKRIMTGYALLDGRPVAAIMILCHGCGATYQLGWRDFRSDTTGAHNLLLWHAVLRLKDKGYSDFDLGGINDQTAKTIAHFKQGMGGEKQSFAGHYV